MKTVIEMARDAGMAGFDGVVHAAFQLEAFAALVRADEREVLAQPVQEPVARVIDNGTLEGATEWIPFTNRVEPLKTGDLLYGEPPERTWVGLTDDEIEKTLKVYEPEYQLIAFARAIEAKLKEKNT